MHVGGAGTSSGMATGMASMVMVTATVSGGAAAQTSSSSGMGSGSGTVTTNGAEQLQGLSSAGGFVMLAGMGVGFALFL
jgi:hypothetical protein